MLSSNANEQDMNYLQGKLDTLQHALDSLPDRLTSAIQEQLTSKKTRTSTFGEALHFIARDILEEDEAIMYQAGSANSALSPDAQIQRLTAQLTAAYNRIAALEEQLLNKRHLV